MRSLSLLSFVLPLVSAFNSYRWPLNDCLNDHNVPLLLASSVGWAEEIEPYNLRFALTPNVVTIPRNVADVCLPHPPPPPACSTAIANESQVQAAVRCAYDAGIKVTVRSGGHSYGAYGLYGAMVLDLSEFQDVTLDSSNIASVGGGVRLGNMATKIFNLGQRAYVPPPLSLHSRKSNTTYSLPHGTCPGVGVGGHGTLGGFGYSSRYWGLLVDTIVKFDVVHADGTFESVTATSNPDLFWALRGAGPGFAIVVTFYFETLPAPEENINWSYTYTFSSAYYAAISFEFATNWAYQNAPKELGFGIFVSANQFVVQGVYPGSIAALDDILAPLLAEMISLNEGKTPESSVQSYNWIDSLTVLGGGHLETPPEGDHSHDTFVSPSFFFSPILNKVNVDSMSNHSTHTNARRSRTPLSKASSHTCSPRLPRPTRNGSSSPTSTAVLTQSLLPSHRPRILPRPAPTPAVTRDMYGSCMGTRGTRCHRSMLTLLAL